MIRCVSRPLSRLAVPLCLTLGLLAGRVAADTKHYVCPPCGAPCDGKVFDHPGVCPGCGMTLVDQATVAAAQAAAPARKRIAILLFDGVEIIDSMGPYEVFGAAGYDVYTVGATHDGVTSAMGQKMVPKYAFADAPEPDVLVVPGGAIGSALHSPATLDWVRQQTARDTHTMSVCNGAFILASAGLLDGLTATTTAGNIPKLRAQYPKVHVVADQRYVDNGKIITTGGLSAGIDGALHVVDLMDGAGTAQQVALGEEYDWHAHSGFARAALADQQIPNVPLDSLGHWHIVRTEGDREHWDVEFAGTSELDAGALLERIDRAFAQKGNWQPVGEPTRGTPARGAWKFTGTDGAPWRGTLTIEPAANHALSARLSIARS